MFVNLFGEIDMFVSLHWGSPHVCQSTMGN